MNISVSSLTRRIRADWLTPLAIIAGSLPALYPLLFGHLPWRADGLLHLHRLAQLTRAVEYGYFYPRWLPDLGFGYGFPLFNYYAPLSYYIALPLTLGGAPAALAIRASYILAIIGLAVALYLWVRDLAGPKAGLAAAFSGVYAPYILYDAHHRGVLPELWGLTWLAFSLWSVYRLSRRPDAVGLILTSLSLAGLILSHNIMAMIGMGLVVAYALALLWENGRPAANAPLKRGRLSRLNALPWLAIGLGLGLAAFFWLPAFMEREYVQIDRLYGASHFHYANNFLSVRELAATPAPADPDLVNPPIPFGLAWPALILALLSWAPRLPPLPGHLRFHRAALTAGLLGLSFMLLPASQFVWDAIPLLRFVLFPWRLLGPASLLLAALAGIAILRLPGPSALWPPLYLAAAGLFALPWLFPAIYAASPATDALDTLRFEIASGAMGTTSVADYLPVDVTEIPPPDDLLSLYEAHAPNYLIPRLIAEQLPPGTRVEETQQDLLAGSYRIAADAPARLSFRWFYFPGWQAALNGQPHPVQAEGPAGLVAVDVPAGEHTLTLRFGDTPLQRWSRRISWAALLSLPLLLILFGRRAAANAGRPAIKNGDKKTLLACLLVGLLLFAGRAGPLENRDSLFRQSRFDGQTLRDMDEPRQVSFGAQLVLLGFDRPAEPTPADRLLEIDLYWRALPPLAQDVSVALHLVDGEGRLAGQHDSYHPAGYPTSRWRAEEYARDRHRLAIEPGAPPGVYRLLVYVYEMDSGRRLEYLNEAGQPLGLGYELTEISVSRPARFPDPAELGMDHAPAVELAPGLRLLGWQRPPAQAITGETIPLTLFWQATTGDAARYQAQLRLVDEAGETAAAMSWSPGLASHPTDEWLAGEIVRDGRFFLLPAVRFKDRTQAIAAGHYRLEIALVDDQGDSQAPPLTIGEINVATPPRSFDPPSDSQPLEIVLDQTIRLSSYQIDQQEIAAGKPISLTLFWQAQAPIAHSYTTFIHLVGPDGQIAAQVDQIPAGGSRPTTGWLPGEFIRDIYQLSLPDSAIPGEYEIRVGLYDPATGDRLPLTGRPDKDYIRLPVVIEIN